MKEKTTLILGDCLEKLEDVPNNSVDLIILDPPYSSGTRQVSNMKAGAIPKRGLKWAKSGIIWDSSFSSFGLSVFLNTFYRKIKFKLKEGAHIYTFIDWRHYPLLTNTIESSGLFINNLLVWDKEMFTLGGNYRSQYELIVFASRGAPKRLNTTTTGNVLKFKRVVNGVHPTEKSVGLLSKLILVASNAGDLVLDPFMGSGTTGIAAVKLQRKFIGIEIDPTYFEIANERIKDVENQSRLTVANWQDKTKGTP